MAAMRQLLEKVFTHKNLDTSRLKLLLFTMRTQLQAQGICVIMINGYSGDYAGILLTYV